MPFEPACTLFRSTSLFRSFLLVNADTQVCLVPELVDVRWCFECASCNDTPCPLLSSGCMPFESACAAIRAKFLTCASLLVNADTQVCLVPESVDVRWCFRS